MMGYFFLIITSLIASFYLKQGLVYKVVKNYKNLNEWNNNEFLFCIGIIWSSLFTIFTGSYLSVIL